MNELNGDAAQTGSVPDTSVFAVLHAARALEGRVEDALSKAGLSSPKFSVLNELVRSGAPVSLSELASRLSCVRSNMTQLVDRLEAEGLVSHRRQGGRRHAWGHAWGRWPTGGVEAAIMGVA